MHVGFSVHFPLLLLINLSVLFEDPVHTAQQTLSISITQYQSTSWLHRASNNVETFSLPTDAHNVKKHRVIKTF